MKFRKLKIRNIYAQSAHFKNSSGPISDKKKKFNKDFCDKKNVDLFEDSLYDECLESEFDIET